MKRDEVLDAARQAITVEREAVHGDASDNFAMIARLWGAYLLQPITSADVANLMILLKVARARDHAWVTDHWVDAVGYAALGAEVALNDPYAPVKFA